MLAAALSCHRHFCIYILFYCIAPKNLYLVSGLRIKHRFWINGCKLQHVLFHLRLSLHLWRTNLSYFIIFGRLYGNWEGLKIDFQAVSSVETTETCCTFHMFRENLVNYSFRLLFNVWRTSCSFPSFNQIHFY